MTRAYVVCGCESSGNRLLAAILCRSGCLGEGSHRQPQYPSELPVCQGRPYVLIHHFDLDPWIEQLQENGFEPFLLYIAREPFAQAESAVQRGHYLDRQLVRDAKVVHLAGILRTAKKYELPLEIVTYEGLTEAALAKWLPTIGLEYRSGALKLPGQPYKAIQNANRKHYG